MSTEIDPTAVIAGDAEIGREVRIGPFCIIGEDVRIGDGCKFESHVVVEGPTVLGDNNLIAPFASIGGPPQDRKYAGEPTKLVVGAGNRIREYTTINRGTVHGGGVTTVGDDNLMMAYTHIAHDCIVGDHIEFANAATLGGHVEVGDYANVGAFSGVHQFCRIARHAFIGGYSVVTQDALPWVLTVGNRATTHGVNIIGLKRAGYPEETIKAIKKCYMTLFRSKKKLADAISEIDTELGHMEEISYFLEFVRTTERGICR